MVGPGCSHPTMNGDWPGRPASNRRTVSTDAITQPSLPGRSLILINQVGCPIDAAFGHFVKRNGDLKWSMLSELGRLPDAETIRAVARIVGRQRLPTAHATALIRRIRVGDRTPQPDRLTKAILTAITTHRARFPTTSETEIRAALDAAAVAVHKDASSATE